jgi:TRAP-type mannitol/chloroaromatic compound transport system permease small subunit
MTAAFSIIDRAIKALVELMLWGAGLSVILLLIIGSVDVIGTQFFGKAVPSGIEFQEAFMGMMLFAALPAIQKRRAHIVVDLLTQTFSVGLQKCSEFLALLLGSVAFTVLAWQQWNLAARSMAIWELSPGFVAFPLWAVKLFVAVAAGIAALEFVRQTVRVLVFWRNGDPQLTAAVSTVTH